jgi:antitoxin YefM
MTIHTTYTKARANFAKLLDEVTKNQETIIINRRGEEKVAMIAQSELSSLLETAYLLRSPKNADRLITALERALKRKIKPMTLAKLRLEVGLDSKKA